MRQKTVTINQAVGGYTIETYDPIEPTEEERKKGMCPDTKKETVIATNLSEVSNRLFKFFGGDKKMDKFGLKAGA